MGPLVTEIIVAIIGAIAVIASVLIPLLTGLGRARTENRDQHREVATELGRLSGIVETTHAEVRDLRSDHMRHLDRHPPKVK